MIDDFLDFLAYLDLVDRIEGIVSTFKNADWEGAWKRYSVVGIVGEFLSSLISHNAPTIFMRRNQGWSGIAVERLLKKYGVKVWDRGLAGDQLYFKVERRQVNWAEYLLKRAGVPITTTHGDPRNDEWAARHDAPPKRNRQ